MALGGMQAGLRHRRAMAQGVSDGLNLFEFGGGGGRFLDKPVDAGGLRGVEFSQRVGGEVGAVVGGPPLLLRRRPQPHASAWSQPAGAPGPLLSTGLAGGQGDRAIEPPGWVEAVAAAQAAIHHQGDAGDGE
jgi:hypothetical protein